MSKEFTIKKGHRVWIGNYPFLLTSDADGIFETVIDSPDALAEVLATNPALYAGHRDDLAYDEDGFENVEVARVGLDKKPILGPFGQPVYDIEAKPVKVHVTYGNNGERIEHKKGDKDTIDVKKQTAEQKKAMAEADKVAEQEAKKNEKLRDDLAGTPAEAALLIEEQDQEMRDAKGAADAKARRDLEIARHSGPGGTAGPTI